MKIIMYIIFISAFFTVIQDMVSNSPDNKARAAQVASEKRKQEDEKNKADQKILAEAIEMENPDVRFAEKGNQAYMSIHLNLTNKSDKPISRHMAKFSVYDRSGKEITSSEIGIDQYLLPGKKTKISSVYRLDAGDHQSFLNAGGSRAIGSVSYTPTVIFFYGGNIVGLN